MCDEKTCSSGRRRIVKGWSDKETYGVIFDEEFQNAALARRTERLNNQQTHEHDSVITDLENLARKVSVDAERILNLLKPQLKSRKRPQTQHHTQQGRLHLILK